MVGGRISLTDAWGLKAFVYDFLPELEGGGGKEERNKRRPAGSFLKNRFSHLFRFNKWVYNGLLKTRGRNTCL